MDWLAEALGLASLGAWMYLLAGRGSFWRAAPLLQRHAVGSAPWPAVAAVVPARNEAEFVARAVRSLVAQDYPGRLTVIVVDDQSDDGTGAAAHAAVPDPAPERMMEVVAGADKPPGWTGKLWALDQGIARADELAPGVDFLWLTDADIEHAPDVLSRLVATSRSESRDLVSLMVTLHCRSPWERLLIPAFVFFFRKLYPFAWVNDAASRKAAAAGGCVLLRRAALDRIGGIAAIRNELIDDCALARAVKTGGPIWLALGHDSRSLRAYAGLAGIWSMVVRTAFHQLRYSPLLAAAAMLGMAVVYAAPPLLVLAWPVHGSAAAAALGGLAWMAMTVAYAPTLRLYRRPAVAGLLLPVAALLYASMIADSARRHWRGRGGGWKSRYHEPET